MNVLLTPEVQVHTWARYHSWSSFYDNSTWTDFDVWQAPALFGWYFFLVFGSKINKKAPIAICEVARPRRYNYRHEFRVEVQGEQVWTAIITCRCMHRLVWCNCFKWGWSGLSHLPWRSSESFSVSFSIFSSQHDYLRKAQLSSFFKNKVTNEPTSW